MTHMSKRPPEVSEDEITQLFNEVDLDGDGFISPKEAKRAYKKLSKVLNRENDKVRKYSAKVNWGCIRIQFYIHR